MCVEVLTPEGNWSSYPPHKHDQASETEAELEEIYYFEVRGEHGYGIHRTYTADRDIDETVVVTPATPSSSPAATTARASPRPATICTT